MFNTTHTLAGLGIARTATEKWLRYTATTAVIAANLPDIDSVAGFWGTAPYLDHHRGITHSLIGIPILSLLLSAVMYYFSRDFVRTYIVALAAMATHPALDYLNSYGVRPFLPWNDKWYYGDALFIFDPYLDIILLLGIVYGSRRPGRRRFSAVLSLVLGITYIGARMQLHSSAVAHTNASFSNSSVRLPEKWALLPRMWNLIGWDLIAAYKNEVANDEVSMKTDPPSPIVRQAAAAPSADALLRFARFPVTRVGKLPSGYRVTFLDFRFYSSETNTALAAEVILDDSLRIMRDDISFVSRLQH